MFRSWLFERFSFFLCAIYVRAYIDFLVPKIRSVFFDERHALPMYA